MPQNRAEPEKLLTLPLEDEPLPGTLTLRQLAGGQWYYEPPIYCERRYILGVPGDRPLVCIGINPSTAVPGALDPTLKSVERLAGANGYDGWIMFNVYPQRATDPNAMDDTVREEWHRRNVAWLAQVVAEKDATLWAAWGTLIEKRDYLPGLVRQLAACAPNAPWVHFGALSKAGHPHHPLYLRKDTFPEPFDIHGYLDALQTH